MQDVSFTIRGVSPLLLHNGQTANPLNAFAKQLKEVSKKRNKTDEDYEALAEIEFYAGLYVNQAGQYVMPAHNLEALIVDGAKRAKNGKTMQSGTYVVDEPQLVFDGSDKDPKELFDDGKHALSVTVRVGQIRVLRTRPMIPVGWTMEFTVRYNPEVTDESTIRQSLEVAGLEKGLGDWRPKYGRFEVEIL